MKTNSVLTVGTEENKLIANLLRKLVLKASFGMLFFYYYKSVDFIGENDI